MTTDPRADPTTRELRADHEPARADCGNKFTGNCGQCQRCMSDTIRELREAVRVMGNELAAWRKDEHGKFCGEKSLRRITDANPIAAAAVKGAQT